MTSGTTWQHVNCVQGDYKNPPVRTPIISYNTVQWMILGMEEDSIIPFSLGGVVGGQSCVPCHGLWIFV